MSDKIRVLIVDDLPETRENVRKLLQFEPDIEVIGQAGTGEEAIEMAQEHQPDIILMDINMPGVDGIGASQTISELVPHAQIVIMSVQSDSDYLRRAMLAGARDFLTKPFGGDELVTAIRRVHEKRPSSSTGPLPKTPRGGTAVAEPTASVKEGKIITVFSPKGGSGCTTIAVNLAVALAKQGHRTILVDVSLQFGDVAVMMNMKPITNIIDVVERMNELDAELIESVVQVHKSGAHVLLAPPRPEMADVVTEDKVKRLIEVLRDVYDFIIFDTSSNLDDVTLALLDTADRIMLITQQSLPTLKNASRFFDLSQSLNYDSDKVWLLVNRATNKSGIAVKDISRILKRPIVMSIPGADTVANAAADQGVPLLSTAGRKQPIGAALTQLAEHVIQELEEEDAATSGTDSDNGDKPSQAKTAEKSGGFLSRLFGND